MSTITPERKQLLVNFIVSVIRDKWLDQQRHAIMAEAELAAANATNLVYREQAANNHDLDFTLPRERDTKYLTETAIRERTEASSQKEAYELLLTEIFEKYVH